MEHLLKKINLRGGGSKKPKVTPATLRAPTVGDFQFSSSFSFVETLDLISDGPIEGLVNSNGSLLGNRTASQGIYFNGTPISITNDQLINGFFEVNEVALPNSDIDTVAIANHLQIFNATSSENQLFKYQLVPDGNKMNMFFSDRLNSYQYYNDRSYQIGGIPLPSDGRVRFQPQNVYVSHIIKPSNLDYLICVGDVAAAMRMSDEYPDLGGTRNVDAIGGRFDRIIQANNAAKHLDTINVYMQEIISIHMTRIFGDGWAELDKLQLHNAFFSSEGEKAIGIVYDIEGSGLFTAGQSVLDVNGEIKNSVFFPNNGVSPITSDGAGNVKNLLIPVVDTSGNLTGEVLGLYYIYKSFDDFIETQEKKFVPVMIHSDMMEFIKNVSQFSLGEIKGISSAQAATGGKYNYTNVLLETRDGKESQTPFEYFNNVYIDKNLQQELYGPYIIGQEVQRLLQPKLRTDLTQQGTELFHNTPDVDGDGLPDNEGSADNQRGQLLTDSFTQWNNNNASNIGNELAIPLTHVIYNPNVSEVFVTLAVNALYDTVEVSKGEGDDNLKAGDKIPAILNIQIETGKINANGQESEQQTFNYRITAVIESLTLIDVGNPSSQGTSADYRYIKDLNNEEHNLNVPFKLPEIQYNNNIKSDETPEKRYVRVTKLSTETFSILLKKDITLSKITEIIKANFSYPYSAVIGTKIDSRQFNSIPERTFDVKLKKIKVPSNYFPSNSLAHNRDKRYYNKIVDFENASNESKYIYKGDWDGTFVERWTDNPAWILFDLLTNSRYGLGQQISEDEVNKWELYKIGRFCDAVDDNGYFVGVPDAQGGLEPRFSCNIIFNNNEKIFDSIQTISELFRGKTFFRSSEVSFSDERVKDPIALFNNINVKDGVFNYANLRRDQQYNTVEVGYLDRFENFAPKIEVVEDAEDIRDRGVFKTTIDALGVTSKAMARRIGQHLIYKTIKENQKVVFNTGFEALLCQPGDLIIVEDELKSNKSNFGKVLDVDVDNEYIRLSGPYDPSTMNASLTVYIPTGDQPTEELSEKASTLRERSYTSFEIVDDTPFSFFSDYLGEYGFSGYTPGFSAGVILGDINSDDPVGFYEEYPVYTGSLNQTIYFYPNNNDLIPNGNWVFTQGGIHIFPDPLADYQFTTENNEQTLTEVNQKGILHSLTLGTDYDISEQGFFVGMNNTQGILTEEIVLGSNPQIVTLAVTGDIDDVADYRGSYVSGVDLPDYLPYIKVGSPYRLELTDSSDFVYKIESIQEEGINEYLVSASKFDSGKYELLEQDISIERKENTYAYDINSQVGDITYNTLDTPSSLSLVTGAGTDPDTFKIDATWNGVANNNGYSVIIYYPNGSYEEVLLPKDVDFAAFDNISSIGNFNVSVKANGGFDTQNKYFDSEYISEEAFFLYEDNAEFDKPFFSQITFY